MKKIFAFIIVLFIAFSVIGCESEDKSHTIVFYHTMGDNLQKVLAVAKDTFEQKFPGWKVEDTAVGGYDDVKSAIIADLQGKTQPSLAYCYADHVAQYLQTGKVVDMTKYINDENLIDVVNVTVQVDENGDPIMDSDNNPVTTTSNGQERIGYTAEEIADFVPGYYAEGLATNYADYDKYGYTATSMLTLPFVKSTELMYYNETALIAAGVVDADGKADVPETWAELWAACEKITAKYPKCVPLGYDSEANWFITMCEQNGWGYTNAASPHYVFNSTEATNWLNQLNEFYEAGYITTQSEYGSYTSNLFTKGAEEGVVFSIGSSGGASHQKPADGLFDWGVARVPGSALADGTVNNSAISQGPSLCMFYEDTENQEEKALMTWEFVKILLEPRFQASFSIASGYNPARESSYEIDDYITHLTGTSITAIAASVARTMTEDFFTSPAFIGSSTARDQVGNALVYALTGEKSAEKALADAMKNCGA